MNIGVLDPEVKENLIVQSEREKSSFSYYDPEVRQVAVTHIRMVGFYSRIILSGAMNAALN